MVSRLASVEIDKLFGLYERRVPVNTDRHITAIIGPNGSGKTVCLRMINALYTKNYAFFTQVPFEEARFYFTGGEKVVVRANVMPPEGAVSSRLNGDRAKKTVEFIFSNSVGHVVSWFPVQLDPSNKAVRDISRFLPFLTRADADKWVDDRDGEELSLALILSRYSNRLPKAALENLKAAEPAEFLALTEPVHCQLIETQRLLASASDVVDPDEHYGFRRARAEQNLAIRHKAEKLNAILGATLADYATLSQSLDRSFPRRVLEAQGRPALSGEELRKELEALDAQRQALMSAGIINTEFEPVAVNSGPIDPGVAKVLEIYAQDAQRKLAKFASLLEKINLFKEMIEDRFMDKFIRIDRQNGFEISSKSGRSIPLGRLSSGEQHQLILFFDLIFDIQENSLILIDEPELSLHVTWQKSFIDSLQRMIALTPFDVILATHSPSLVAKNFSLAVELGEVDVPSDD